MKANFYTIEALTNLHVGSGDANYGVIDNLVQRDPVTELPTINGSSLKGALREFFEAQWGKDDIRIRSIFGDNDQNASYRFLSANLTALPVRSNKKAYFLATAPMVINQLKINVNNFGLKNDLSLLDGLHPQVKKPMVFENSTGLLIEDFENFDVQNRTGSLFSNDLKNWAYFNDADFKTLCSDTNLPVVARNKVGENLWYEQIVPHKSLFSFVLIHNDKDIEEFEKTMTEQPVHIGAYASVGYGYCKISKM